MKKNLLFTMFLFAAMALQSQTIIYVKPDGVGDGSSWSNACNLGDAMSKSGTQIWVQKGTYYPTEMLSLPNSVKMYGGFSGTESNLSQRDSMSNSTIIDAQKKFGSVVRLGVSAELNGFVIQNGYAQKNPHNSGGGVFADENSVIANCLIINNTASGRGGGVYSKGPIKIIGSTIKDNISTGSGTNVFGDCLTVLGRSDEVVPVEPEEPIVTTGCVEGTFNFGVVSFVSETTRTITGTIDGKSVTQVWSAPVTATSCNKNAFNGGSSSNYNVDCRKNTTPSYGDLFSWCAVVKYASTLCPEPWRVPTKEDFINLDKIMGGTGANREGVSSELPTYFATGSNQWGGAFSGYANASLLYGQGSDAHYWSQPEFDADYAYNLRLDLSGIIYPQNYTNKYLGFPLRCVK